MSAYKFWYMGEWRPVSNMLRGKTEVFHPEQAAAVVIFVEGFGFEAVAANPAEIFTTGDVAASAGGAWDSI